MCQTQNSAYEQVCQNINYRDRERVWIWRRPTSVLWKDLNNLPTQTRELFKALQQLSNSLNTVLQVVESTFNVLTLWDLKHHILLGMLKVCSQMG